MLKKIIIVEDDDGIRELMQMILEGDGYEVDCFSEFSKKLENLRNEKSLLFLVDSYLENGKDVTEKFKSFVSPTILVSARHDITRLARIGKFTDYLPKPFEISDLLLKVKKYEKRKLTGEN
jgi:DNA-binding response OmpR family regulator